MNDLDGVVSRVADFADLKLSEQLRQQVALPRSTSVPIVACMRTSGWRTSGITRAELLRDLDLVLERYGFDTGADPPRPGLGCTAWHACCSSPHQPWQQRQPIGCGADRGASGGCGKSNPPQTAPTLRGARTRNGHFQNATTEGNWRHGGQGGWRGLPWAPEAAGLKSVVEAGGSGLIRLPGMLLANAESTPPMIGVPVPDWLGFGDNPWTVRQVGGCPLDAAPQSWTPRAIEAPTGCLVLR